jgi:hypothetical protein
MRYLLGFLLKSLARVVGLILLVVGVAAMGLAAIMVAIAVSPSVGLAFAFYFRLLRWVVGVIMTPLDYAMSLAYEVYIYGQRHSSYWDAPDAPTGDSRPPILLLRSFSDDHAAVANADLMLRYEWIFGGKSIRSFEEALVAKLGAYGPVIALGRPGEKLPPLGATRQWVADDRWQARVEELLRDCRLVVMVVGEIQEESSLAWEFGRILSLKEPEKVIIVVPPLDEWDAARRWLICHRMSGGRIPPYQGGEVAARLTAGGGCRVVRFGSRADGDYMVALGDLIGLAPGPSPARRPVDKLANEFREFFRLLFS